jgi:hypothetical protein
MGFSNDCPFCGLRPEQDRPDIQPWQRRRWQAAHIATAHVKGFE